MRLHNNYNFQKIWCSSNNNWTRKKHNKKIRNHFVPCMPIEWQLILMSDGSFTQSLISLTGGMIKLKIVSKTTYKIFNTCNHVREIWLIDDSYTKLAFAQSIWPIQGNKIQKTLTIKPQPIGKSMIESQIDIYKEIHEVYYGYCKYLEDKFLLDGPVWGRKYTIYHNKKPVTTIQEIFSPKITELFTPYT